MKKNFTIGILLLAALNFTACKKDDKKEDNNGGNTVTQFGTGWTGSDNVSQVPTSLNFGFATTSLPASVDLTPYLPPIGNQLTDGTCVAWASGYYAKTASEAIVFNRNQNQLAAPQYQFSPKYLYLNIPDNLKSSCQGTQIVHALDVMQQKGIATQATVPYQMQGCSFGLAQPAWNTEAAGHKIKYYRKIDYSVQSIKQHLANKFPVIIGARIGDNFLAWQGGGVMKSHTTFNQQGLHAMTIVGYDDGRGAFRIANSWGTAWGDYGYIWVEYGFAINNFIHERNVYILASDEGSITPTPTTNNGVDLATWVFSDVTTAPQTGFPNTRQLTFNVYNIGSQAAQPSSNWSFYYLYYNAYNANDYGILFQDAFNTSVAANSFFCNNAYSCNFNFSIPAGSSFAQRVFNQSTVNRSYSVPLLNGYYYLVLVADPGGSFSEQNEQNNIFYTTSQLPKVFQNGFSYRGGPDALLFQNALPANTANLKASEFNSAVKKGASNAYTPEEIVHLLKQKAASGDLKQKLEKLAAQKTTGSCVYCP